MSQSRLQQLLRDSSDNNEDDVRDDHHGGATNSANSTFIVSMIQNRAKEVGLAALDTRTCSTLWLAQYIEATRSFTNTLTMLERYPPNEILVVSNTDSILAQEIGGLNAALKSFPTTPRPRSTFDDSEGTVLVQMCAINTKSHPGALSSSGTEFFTSSRGNYLALGAAGALLIYMREEQKMVLAPSSLHVRHALSHHHTYIDAATIEALELVNCSSLSSGGDGGATSSASNHMTLFKLLDGTRTRAGAHLLRANILQPLKNCPTLQARYDTLSELRQKNELFTAIDACLMQMPKNMDAVCGSLVLRPAKTEAGTIRRVSAMIQSFIQLRELLMVLESLDTALEEAESDLLRVVRGVVSDPRFAQLLIRLDGLLDEDCRSAKGPFLNRTQQCFALHSGLVPLLDVARLAFCSCTDAVHEHAHEVSDAHGLHGLKVKYTARRGFYFTVYNSNNNDLELDEEEKPRPRYPRKRHASSDRVTTNTATTVTATQSLSKSIRLPSSFRILQSDHKTTQFTTDELNALNARLRDAANDCLCLTEEALEAASRDIVEEHMEMLHRLIDGIAVLDMMIGFARQLDATGKNYVRPVLTTEYNFVTSPLALVSCRHAILELAEKQNLSFKPNDTWLSVESSLHIITGPNMAGKSTYLRQVALAVIMAQIGCFVPCDFASLSPVDRVLTRMGTSDNLETNSSSFMVEMQEMNYILRHATPRSLVLIDELGRATSTYDGVGIAWSMAESLATSGCKALLATHFPQLADLARMYPNVRAFHFEITTHNNKVEYTWEMKPGRCTEKHYGLRLAESVAFPQEALQVAKRVVDVLDEKIEAMKMAQEQEQQIDGNNTSEIDIEKERAIWDIGSKVSWLAQAFREFVFSGDARGVDQRPTGAVDADGGSIGTPTTTIPGPLRHHIKELQKQARNILNNSS